MPQNAASRSAPSLQDGVWTRPLRRVLRPQRATPLRILRRTSEGLVVSPVLRRGFEDDRLGCSGIVFLLGPVSGLFASCSLIFIFSGIAESINKMSRIVDGLAPVSH